MNKKNINYNQNNKRDLFFERRKKLNFKLPLLKSNSEIIRFGIYVGGGFFSIVLFACFILLIQFFLLRVKKEKIKPYAIEFDNYISKIKIQNQKIKSLEDLNFKLANGVKNIRSISVVLSEINKLVPKSIYFNEINIKDNTLELEGIIPEKNNYEILNLFLLELSNSNLVKKESVKLINANKDKEDTSFLINAELIENYKNIDIDYIESLGSKGFANRLKLIEVNEFLK